MAKRRKYTKKVLVGLGLLFLTTCVLFLFTQAKHIFVSTKSVNSTSPTPAMYPWDTPLNSWKTYSSDRLSLRYPSTMRVIVTNTEPNAISKKFDALDITISQDNTLDLDIRIEPTYAPENAVDWAYANRKEFAINSPNWINVFNAPIEPYTFNGIQGATQTLSTGMLLGTQLYYPQGNNMIWVGLGINDEEKAERLKYLQEINLQIK